MKSACRACGDEIDAQVAARSDGLCIDCYREIHLGELPVVTDSRGSRVSSSEGDEGGAEPVDPADG